MNTSEPDSPWDEEQIGQLLTRFFQREMPAEFRDAPPSRDMAAPVIPRSITNSNAPRLTLPAPARSSATPSSSGSAGVILGLVVACLGLMVLAMVQTGTPDAPGTPVANTPTEPAAPGTSTVQNPDNRTQPESAVNWQNPANADPDSEPSADPLLQELDIHIFPLEEPARQGDKEKRRQGDR